MATITYKSTDASAPSLSGTVGSLIALLDAVLVNGYGSKPSAGWSKVYSDTNKAVYRAPAGNRFYLRVLDDGSDGTHGAKVATIRGYETMSDVDTGTGPFPTAAQKSAGLFVGKSSTANATARPWFLLADGKRFVLGVANYSSLSNAYEQTCFGDLIGAAPADAYASIIAAVSASANTLSGSPGGGGAYGNIAYTNATSGAIYAPRAASGTGAAAEQISLFPTTATTGSGNINLPSGTDAAGNVWGDRIQIGNGTAAATVLPRGYFPGILYLRNYLDYATYPSFYEFGQYQVVRYNSSHAAAYLIDTGDWE